MEKQQKNKNDENIQQQQKNQIKVVSVSELASYGICPNRLGI